MGWGACESEMCGVTVKSEPVAFPGFDRDGHMFSLPHNGGARLGQVGGVGGDCFKLARDPFCVIGDKTFKRFFWDLFGNRDNWVSISDTDVAVFEAGFAVEGVVKRMYTVVKMVVGDLNLHRSGNRG